MTELSHDDAARVISRLACEASDLGALLATINQHLNGNRRPGAGALGECAAITTIRCVGGNEFHVASLYLHSGAADLKAAEVARWFTDAGCTDVVVAHVLDDADNFTHDGHAEDGVRPWEVTFHAPAR
jgi:hypothetical protein